MTKMNIKTGDTVKVIAGKDKGAQGEVLFAFPEKGRVTVQGVNLVHKALRGYRRLQRHAGLPVVRPADSHRLQGRRGRQGSRLQEVRQGYRLTQRAILAFAEGLTYYLVRFAPRLAPISRTALAANCLSG